MQQLSTKQLTLVDVAQTLESDAKEQKRAAIPWITCCGIKLKMKHRAILSSKGAWLDDELINAAQYMLKQQYPLIGGFQSPILGSTLAMTPPDSEFV